MTNEWDLVVKIDFSLYLFEREKAAVGNFRQQLLADFLKASKAYKPRPTFIIPKFSSVPVFRPQNSPTVDCIHT